MSSFLKIINIKRWIVRIRIERAQLELYYPKHTYNRFARREMKTELARFNEIYYKVYPKMLDGKSSGIIDYHPRTHTRQYDVQRAIKLCKSQKVRGKDLVKIEEYLNLQYIIEEQLRFYSNKIEKAQKTMQILAEEGSSAFFSELFTERIKVLESMETHYIREVYKLENERDICVRAIHDLIYRNDNFFGKASKYVGSLVTESVKNAVEIVNRSFRRVK